MKGIRTAAQAVGVLVGAIMLFLGGLWLFSANEYKAPPARVVAVPEGFDVLGEQTGGGSGGTTTRWVVVAGPEGAAVETIATALVTEMESAGWERVAEGPTCCIPPGALGLMNRGDEWAALDSRTSIESKYGDLLEFDDIVGTRGSVVFVELQYSDWGQGRRYLFE